MGWSGLVLAAVSVRAGGGRDLATLLLVNLGALSGDDVNLFADSEVHAQRPME
jgi:hypothetical protein